MTSAMDWLRDGTIARPRVPNTNNTTTVTENPDAGTDSGSPDAGGDAGGTDAGDPDMG